MSTNYLNPMKLKLHGTQLIEASAGTGKTFTITTLYLRLLLGEDGRAPLTVDQVLVVTFTRAATAELRDKLRDRVRRAATAFDRLARGRPAPGCGDPTIDGWACARQQAGHDPATDHELLTQALRDFDQAAVFTIHGFAQRMLADHAFESGVTFDSEFIADEAALLREIVEDYWARWTYDAPQAFVRHLVSGKHGVESLVTLAGRGAAMPRLRLLPESASDEVGLTARPGLAERIATPQRSWRKAHEAAAALWWAQRTEIQAIVAAAGDGMNKRSYGKLLASPWPIQVDEIMSPESRPPLAARFAKWEKLCASELESGTNKGNEAPRHPFFDALDTLREAELALGDQLETEVSSLYRGLIPYVREESEARKRRWNKQSFSDLLLRLDQAMRSEDEAAEALAAGIRRHYPVALIDEFQDTDPVQYEIFAHVYGAGKPVSEQPPGTALFLIGDPKQAIYGFRGADIFAYLEAKRDTPKNRRWTLAENWRSDPAMIAAVNLLFGRPAAAFALPGLDFASVAPQPDARDQLTGGTLEDRAALRMLVPRRVDFDREEGQRLRKGDEWPAVRDAIASDVVRLLESGLRIGQEPNARPVRPSDIAILVRMNAEAFALQDALRRLGVPSALQGDASVLDGEDAAHVARLLAAMAEPGDPAALRAALCTPILGMDAHDLDNLQVDEARWDAEAARMRVWHDTWHRQGFVQAFRRVLLEARTAERLLAREDGERRLTNLLHLGELLHGAVSQMHLGPQGLRQWLQLVREDARARGELVGDAAQLRLESDAQAVRLVTIHKAKGLEYGIVYCPTLWGAASLRLPDKTWPRCHDAQGRLLLDLGSPEMDAHREEAERELLAEDLRLLYVALTRSRHQCTVVWGAFTNAEKSALAYLLHAASSDESSTAQGTNDDPAETGIATARSAAQSRAAALFGESDDAVTEDLRRRLGAAGAGGAQGEPPRPGRPILHVTDLPPATRRSWRGEAATGTTLAARKVGRAIRRTWRVASFTSLTAGRDDDATDPAAWPGHDRDAIDAAGADGTPDSRTVASVATSSSPTHQPDSTGDRDHDTVPLADFPAGARAGQLLHDIFEHTDFTHRQGYRSLEVQVERRLGAHGFDAAHWPPRLERALSQVLETPLGEGAPALEAVPWGDRIHEMAFMAPLRSDGPTASPRAVAAALEAHPGPGLPARYPERLRDRSWRGLRGALHGYIDLIYRTPRRAREDGRLDPLSSRWYLVDYKSNHLGPTYGDYRPERLAEEMARHDYILQYHLYVVALHRYLRHRMPGYDYEQHFGGVRYLFVRGMRREDGPDRGVFIDRPPLALVEDLERILCGSGPVATAASPAHGADGGRP